MNKRAEEMIQKAQSSSNPEHEPTIKLDAESAKLVNKWLVGSLKSTVATMIGIAAEALDDAEKQLSKTYPTDSDTNEEM